MKEKKQTVGRAPIGVGEVGDEGATSLLLQEGTKCDVLREPILDRGIEGVGYHPLGWSREERPEVVGHEIALTVDVVEVDADFVLSRA